MSYYVWHSRRGRAPCGGEYAARAENLSHRGRDGKTLLIDGAPSEVKDGNTFLLHYLHGVVGNVVQPIQGMGTAINCEIYNWEALAEKYNITAKNDADLVCQLFDRQGVFGRT